MNSKKHLYILITICFVSYFMILNLSVTAVEVQMDGTGKLKSKSVIYDLKDTYIREKKLIQYISGSTNLTYEECEYLIEECKQNNLDPFLLLGVIKRESNFNPHAVGKSGERGLGQLMENTAKPVAENLGYKYDPLKLFDTKYNLKLTITQLSYLYILYNGDIHKTLTAYNRGQQGLKNYINERLSPYDNPAMSEYSNQVINYCHGFKEEFDNIKN